MCALSLFTCGDMSRIRCSKRYNKKAQVRFKVLNLILQLFIKIYKPKPIILDKTTTK